MQRTGLRSHHEKRLNDLPEICKKLQDSNVIIFADPQAYHSLEGHYPPALLKPATPESFGTEFLDYKMAIKTVKSIEDALGHIAEYSSKHSESIITENKECAALFSKIVDAACVYTNVSTAFTDGAQFGLGSPKSVSVRKNCMLAVPMALEETISYKWIIEETDKQRES